MSRDVSLKLGQRVPFEVSTGLISLASSGLGPDSPVRRHLERRAAAFVDGFNIACRSWPRVPDLSSVAPKFRGFAFEGAGSSAAIADCRAGRIGPAMSALIAEHGPRYAHPIYVGYGFRAIVPGRPFKPLPIGVSGWVPYDGAGFADVFFGGDRALRRLERSSGPVDTIRLTGAGRALWFRMCADDERISARIARSTSMARPALWAGVGLAMTYAGGASDARISRLIDASGINRGHLGQGVGFAAYAINRAGAPPMHAVDIVERLFGSSVSSVGEAVEDALFDLTHRSDPWAYHLWRQRVHGLVRS